MNVKIREAETGARLISKNFLVFSDRNRELHSVEIRFLPKNKGADTISFQDARKSFLKFFLILFNCGNRAAVVTQKWDGEERNRGEEFA